MLVINVAIHVKPTAVEAFKAATIENATASIREPGVARFDLLQDTKDPSRFLLVEAYRTPDAPAAHKATAHYAKWRDTVADMMAVPRSSETFAAIFPVS